MNDSDSRREIGAELFIMAGAAWVIPAGNGGMFPHRRISLVPLPGYFNPRDISWVVEYPASQLPAETAPRPNAWILCGRMIRSGALRRVFALGAILLGLLSFFVAVGRSEAQPIAMVTDVVGRAEAVNNTSRAPLGILADLTDGARVELNPGAGQRAAARAGGAVTVGCRVRHVTECRNRLFRYVWDQSDVQVLTHAADASVSRPGSKNGS